MKEIYILEDEQSKKIYLIEDNQILEKHEEVKSNPMLEGNIYAGKVQNVLSGMQSAFVNIGSGKNAFIHLRDILPKRDVVEDSDQPDVKIQDVIRPRRFYFSTSYQR